MTEEQALSLIAKLLAWTDRQGVDLVLVGSVAYRRGVPDATYGDVDAVVVYEDLAQLRESAYLGGPLLKVARGALASGTADLFATKCTSLPGTLSLDFVSRQYLQELASLRQFEGSRFLSKLTTAKEADVLIVHGVNGSVREYVKPVRDYHGLRLYRLPVYYREGGELFPGVLMNKLLDASVVLRDGRGSTDRLLDTLFANYVRAFVTETGGTDWNRAFRRWEGYSTAAQIEMTARAERILSTRVSASGCA